MYIRKNDVNGVLGDEGKRVHIIRIGKNVEKQVGKRSQHSGSFSCRVLV